ncbi:MAG: rhomboid family intramembrane serine protease [Anaerolineales bacterium]|nr:rhomboid family intramembrane serine protease [Anaerolineales bacterium]
MWWLITPVFLIRLFAHIFFNMYALFSVGTLLETSLWARAFFPYIFRRIRRNVMSFLLPIRVDIPCGASTVVAWVDRRRSHFLLSKSRVIWLTRGRRSAMPCLSS